MDETILEKTVHALVFLGICAAIIFIGWREPLRYRFMSPDEIAEVEGDRHPAPRPWQPASNPSGTALDRAPYEVKGGKLRYSEQYDSREMGSRTETDRRKNTTGKQ
jgi:hypothetical protein